MELYAAIDLMGGKMVRLVQGDPARSTVYGDPVEAARRLAAARADWLHVVDLDAAMTGNPENQSLVAEVIGAVDVPVQVGGGIRDRARAEGLLEMGVSRIVVGTAVLESPDIVRALARDHPGKVALGIDHRAGRRVAVQGWTRNTASRVASLLASMADSGVAAVIVTDIARDGTLAGPDLYGLSRALASTHIDLIASGGVASANDICRLGQLTARGRRLSGVVVGKAIHDGVLPIRDALKACAASA